MEAAHTAGQSSPEYECCGDWVAYHPDFSDLAVFPDELSARRYAADNYMDVHFMLFGKSFKDQIREPQRPVHHQRALA